MCPFIALVVLFQLLVLICNVTSITFNIELPLNQIKLVEGSKKSFNYSIDEFDNKQNLSRLLFQINDKKVADVWPNFIELYELPKPHNASFQVKTKTVGFTKLDVIFVEFNETNKLVTTSKKLLKSIDIVAPVNENQILATLFTVMVAFLVSLNTINMGCALDLEVVKNTLRKPTAILIGTFAHYFFMPVFGFVIGQILFADVPYLRLSLFIFSCSPGGSAANMWTVLLKGNLNLSITMTFLSTLLAIVMMPLWLFTLGIHIFETNNMQIPYTNILTSLITLVSCIGVGLLIQKFKPKLAKVIISILV